MKILYVLSNRFCWVVLCLMTMAGVQAQDIIVLNDGTAILSKVEEVGETAIKYRKYSNMEGPVYSVSKESVQSITYQNGEKENYTLLNGDSITNPSLTGSSVVVRNTTTALTMDNIMRIEQQIEKLETSGRRRKVWGMICAIEGGLSLVTAFTFWGLDSREESSVEGLIDYVPELFIEGCFFTFVGGSLLVSSASKYKKAETLRSSLAYSHDIEFGNCVLSPTVNLLSDRQHHDSALGIGLSLKF